MVTASDAGVTLIAGAIPIRGAGRGDGRISFRKSRRDACLIHAHHSEHAKTNPGNGGTRTKGDQDDPVLPKNASTEAMKPGRRPDGGELFFG